MDAHAMLLALERESFTEEVAKRLTNHVVLADLRTGKLPKDQADLLLKTLLLEQYFVCNSDLRTLRASCEKFGHVQGYKTFLEFFRDGEAFALGEHQKMCQLLGLSDEQLEAHVPHHKCQAYPSYFSSILLHHSPVVAAAAFVVNFPAWGQMCGILRDSLLVHYDYQMEDLGFLDFFATPIPNLRELVDQVFATEGQKVSYVQLRRSVRLLQEYELLFWDGIWEQVQTPGSEFLGWHLPNFTKQSSCFGNIHKAHQGTVVQQPCGHGLC